MGKSKTLAASLALAWITAAGSSQAAAPPVVEKLRNHGFQCLPLGTFDADICTVEKINTKDFNYPLPVGIVVPRNALRADSIVVHIHGFQNVCRTETIKKPAGIVEDFNLQAGLKESEIENAVMVVPLGYGKMSTFKANLLPQFPAFLAWVTAQAGSKQPRFIFSGHSGAGPFIGRTLIQNPEIARLTDSVILMDASYGSSSGMIANINSWTDVLRSNPALRIYSVYKPGTLTAKLSHAFQKSFPGNVRLYPAEEQHCAIPGLYLGRLLKDSLPAPATAHNPQ